jgi:hypothetical protein
MPTFLPPSTLPTSPGVCGPGVYRLRELQFLGTKVNVSLRT